VLERAIDYDHRGSTHTMGDKTSQGKHQSPYIIVAGYRGRLWMQTRLPGSANPENGFSPRRFLAKLS
jgi:hypothetical protein